LNGSYQDMPNLNTIAVDVPIARIHQRHQSLLAGTPEARMNGFAPININQDPE